MNTIHTSLLALLSMMILTFSMGLIADQASESSSSPSDVVVKSGGAWQPDGTAKSELIAASSRKRVVPNSGALTILPESSAIAAADAQDGPPREEVWKDISEAITSLNDMVGDDMFRQLTRKSATAMEVRVDLDYWQRVRYETRVDLKNDISNIWHLYVRQFNEDNESAVFFIDYRSGKTIDIFTQRWRSEE